MYRNVDAESMSSACALNQIDLSCTCFGSAHFKARSVRGQIVLRMGANLPPRVS